MDLIYWFDKKRLFWSDRKFDNEIWSLVNRIMWVSAIEPLFTVQCIEFETFNMTPDPWANILRHLGFWKNVQKCFASFFVYIINVRTIFHEKFVNFQRTYSNFIFMITKYYFQKIYTKSISKFALQNINQSLPRPILFSHFYSNKHNEIKLTSINLFTKDAIENKIDSIHEANCALQLKKDGFLKKNGI